MLPQHVEDCFHYKNAVQHVLQTNSWYQKMQIRGIKNLKKFLLYSISSGSRGPLESCSAGVQRLDVWNETCLCAVSGGNVGIVASKIYWGSNHSALHVSMEHFKFYFTHGGVEMICTWLATLDLRIWQTFSFILLSPPLTFINYTKPCI